MANMPLPWMVEVRVVILAGMVRYVAEGAALSPMSSMIL
jgi:hypothetical protein